MIRALLALLCATTVGWALTAVPPQDPPQPDPEPVQTPIIRYGSVLAVGGIEAMEQGLLDALGRLDVDSPIVLIVPHASDEETRGQAEKEAFERLGITQVNVLPNLEGEDTVALLSNADVIWFSDGSPGHLMRQLAAAGVISNFYQWHKQGTLIGANGQTAGVLGIVYVEGLIDEPYMTHLSVRPRRGLGLWNGLVLTDMMNENRLAHGISAVLDQNRIMGLCQDRHSAVRILGDDMFFTGKGSTMVIDARRAKKTWINEESTHSLRDVKLHTFAMGETFTWMQ